MKYIIITIILVSCKNCSINEITKKASEQFDKEIIGQINYITHEKSICTFYINNNDTPYYIDYWHFNGYSIADIVKRGDSVFKFKFDSVYYFKTKNSDILKIDCAIRKPLYTKMTTKSFYQIRKAKLNGK